MPNKINPQSRGSGFKTTKWSQRWCSLLVALQLNLIHTKEPESFKVLFVTHFHLFIFHRNNRLLRLVWEYMLLLHLNILHFNMICIFIYFLKATTFYQHVMMKRTYERNNERFWVLLLSVIPINGKVFYLFCSFPTSYGARVERFSVKKFYLTGFFLTGEDGGSPPTSQKFAHPAAGKILSSKDFATKFLFLSTKGYFTIFML